MVKRIIKGQSVLAFTAAALFGAISAINALRGQGGVTLVTFMFAYICCDLGRGFLKEGDEA